MTFACNVDRARCFDVVILGAGSPADRTVQRVDRTPARV
ncbi:hypothetical protein BJY18_005697 [Amycolatopsis jiangsuensis]|uniref:Uncharacterized protein n=1 Tax=Amycolatopsis jiangsuensis TaxID=1181879 RepID=A0A840J472_9PSEU|nr:hypothetical protein [Amycolatopsis jiangsuensis]